MQQLAEEVEAIKKEDNRKRELDLDTRLAMSLEHDEKRARDNLTKIIIEHDAEQNTTEPKHGPRKVFSAFIHFSLAVKPCLHRCGSIGRNMRQCSGVCNLVAEISKKSTSGVT